MLFRETAFSSGSQKLRTREMDYNVLSNYLLATKGLRQESDKNKTTKRGILLGKPQGGSNCFPLCCPSLSEGSELPSWSHSAAMMIFKYAWLTEAVK